MPPEHARLSALLEGAALERGSVAALARDLNLNRREIERLIAGQRFVTVRQALKIEALGVSARELLIEAAIAKVDEELAKVRGQS